VVLTCSPPKDIEGKLQLSCGHGDDKRIQQFGDHAAELDIQETADSL